MRLSKQELNLLKEFSKMANKTVILKIYGDILFAGGKLLAKSEKSCVKVEITNNNVNIIDNNLHDYLYNKFVMTETNIQEFDWADQINLNYIELQVQNKIYKNREEFFEHYFKIAFKYFQSGSLTIMYRTKDKIYTALYFRDNKKFYNEFIVTDNKMRFKILLLNVQKYVHLDARVKDLVFLAIAPNYETPNIKSYLAQLNTLAYRSSFRFEQ